MGEGLYTVDAEGRLTTMNRAAENLLGWTFGEIRGRNMHDVAHHHYPDGRPFPAEECAGLEVLRERRTLTNHEDVFIRKDGTFFDVIYSSSPLNSVSGNVIGLVVVFRDITERKKARGLLERYRILSEKSGDIIWFMRLDGSFVDVNHAAVETYGYTRDEFLQMSVRDLRHPNEVAEFQNQLDSARGAGTHFETVHMSKDGTLIPVEVKANSSDFGGERLIMAIVRDITERKRADEALRKSEELFSRFMQHLPGLAWVKEVDGRYVYANDAAERTFGTPRERLYGELDANLFSPDVAEAFVANDQRALAEGTGVQSVETLEHKDGALHHSIVSKFPIFGPDGTVQFIGGMAIDITDQMRAEEALRESEERLQLAQRAGNVAIFDWNIATGKTHMSENIGLLYGEMPQDTPPGEPFWNKYLHINDLGRVKRRLGKALRPGGNEFRDEFRIVGRDGSTRWIEAIARISRDASGAATRMYGVNMDITARREAEEKVRLSENQLKLVTNAIPALISYVDNTEHYRFVNQKFTEWFKMSTDEIIGKGPRDVFGARAYKVLKPHINAALSGQNFAFETVLDYEKIGRRYVHVSYIADVGADGTVYGYYGLTQDLTDLKHSEDLLRSSEERLGLMMDSFTEYAIFSMDVDGRIDSWNKAAEVIFGYSHDEILGRSSDILFTSEDIARGVPATELRTAKKKGRSSYEGWHLKKDGIGFFASAEMMPLYVGDELTGYAKIASDLTEKKRRSEELQRAHDELELRVKERTRELAASNSALVQEMGEREVAERQKIDLLRRLVTSQEFERRRIARDLHDTLGQRLTALRLKIASLGEISTGHTEIAARVGRLQEIAQQLDSEVSFLAWELRPSALDDLGLRDAVGAFVDEWSRHYEISADFHSAGLANERLDRDAETHLYRITQEALNNIVKHAQANHVTVMLERRNDSVILVVEDDGKGFDPVEKAGSADSEKSLGLIGMSERAALVGGEVEIESARGKGTTIYVRVPFGPTDSSI
ncbi:MAG: PAS domain S-box protein [Acidobacteriota bacterium]